MTRDQLEHIIRAAAAIVDRTEIVIIGSQAILGAYPDAPAELLESREADVYPLDNPELADVIDGAIGENSPFDQTFGYYAHGIGPETAVLAPGWQQRVIKVQNSNTDGKTGFCLEPHDLAASKLAAGREKDHAFVLVMLKHALVDRSLVAERVSRLEVAEDVKRAALTWLERQT